MSPLRVALPLVEPRFLSKNQGVPAFPWVGSACARKPESYQGLGLKLRLGFPRYTLMLSRHVDIFGKSGPKTIKKGSSSSKKDEKVAKNTKKSFP
jgi:hypothetical protein